MKQPELLMPAGNLDTLKIAFTYGADAVYLGGEAFSLRAKADNFTLEEMREGIEFAHAKGGKVYVTANIFAHNGDFAEIEKYFNELNELKPDGVLVADPGVFAVAKRILKDIDIHISTQANNTNYESAKLWHELGASRIVTARELPLDQIKELIEKTPEDLEVETFVHGAMCISYSGRCLLSNYFTGRDANRGACTHPCRWRYALVEESRPGQYLPIEENDRGTFIMNSKDLDMVGHIDDLVDASIDSFKVEGRMKSILYVATTARAYRKAIDDYMKSPEEYKSNIEWYEREVRATTNRTFSTGFFYGRPDESAMIYDESTYVTEYVYLGFVEEESEIDGKYVYRMTQKNKFSVGDEIEVMKPDGRNITATVRGLYDEYNNPIESVPHSKQVFFVDIGVELDKYDILRRG